MRGWLVGCVCLFVTISACNTSERPQPRPITPTPVPPVVFGISALQRGGELHHILYSGRWEFVTNRKDGRYNGSSARSFHPGDSLTIVFRGNRLRIYGVTGPTGGWGSLVIPGKQDHTLDFYSTTKRTHRLLFDSGKLVGGELHSAGLVVIRPDGPRHRGYVNIDEVEVTSGA